jgi:hypothetical protein
MRLVFTDVNIAARVTQIKPGAASRKPNRHPHHDGHEEHEVKKLNCNSCGIVLVLRALRGDRKIVPKTYFVA